MFIEIVGKIFFKIVAEIFVGNKNYHLLCVTKLKDMTTCTTCGQVINEVVIIEGKAYGTTCAQNELGIRQFPSWFSGGDWDKAKSERELLDTKNANDFATRKEITAMFWKEWSLLSSAHLQARRNNNDWAVNFISSIIHQLGYFTILAEPNFNTMEEAELGWKESSGSFPYLCNSPKRIEQLSPKQQSIIEKFI